MDYKINWSSSSGHTHFSWQFKEFLANQKEVVFLLCKYGWERFNNVSFAATALKWHVSFVLTTYAPNKTPPRCAAWSNTLQRINNPSKSKPATARRPWGREKTKHPWHDIHMTLLGSMTPWAVTCCRLYRNRLVSYQKQGQKNNHPQDFFLITYHSSRECKKRQKHNRQAQIWFIDAHKR